VQDAWRAGRLVVGTRTRCVRRNALLLGTAGTASTQVTLRHYCVAPCAVFFGWGLQAWPWPSALEGRAGLTVDSACVCMRVVLCRATACERHGECAWRQATDAGGGDVRSSSGWTEQQTGHGTSVQNAEGVRARGGEWSHSGGRSGWRLQADGDWRVSALVQRLI